MGVEPKVPVAFSAALQWTNANVRTWRGADILNLNARHESFRLVGDLVATVAHELIHDAQARLHDDESLPPVLRTLYREGAAVFGVSLLFPKMGDAALGMNARPAHSHPSMTKVHAGQNHWVLGTPVARFRPVQVPPSAGKSASEFEDVRCDIQPSGAISYRQLAGVVAW